MIWGEIQSGRSLRPADKTNQQFEAYFRTNLHLTHTDNGINLSLYTIFSDLRDKDRLAWNNKNESGIGLAAEFDITPHYKLSFGVLYKSEELTLTGGSHSSAVAAVDYSYYRVWSSKRPEMVSNYSRRIILDGWGKIRYPASLSETDHENLRLEGKYRLSLRYQKRQSPMSLSPFFSLGFSADTQRRDTYNVIEPSLGLALNFRIGDRGEISIGARYEVECLYLSGEKYDGGIGFISWYQNF